MAAGWVHTVLVKSDGTAVASGSNEYGQCDIPALAEGLIYVDEAASLRTCVLQASYDNGTLHMAWLSGEPACGIICSATDRLSVIQHKLAREMHLSLRSLDVLLPGGVLLRDRLAHDSEARVSTWSK